VSNSFISASVIAFGEPTPPAAGVAEFYWKIQFGGSMTLATNIPIFTHTGIAARR
jgi:hypothetical protein